MIIYKIENKINGKIYIGQTKNSLNNRIGNHLKNRSFVGNALRKHGLQSFKISVIDEAATKEALNEKERYWIELYDCSVPRGYNVVAGGSYSTGFRGRSHSEATRRKISMATAGQNNGMYGRQHSEETRKKIGNAERGFRHSESTKEKMSAAHAGKHWVLSEEAKARLRHPKSEAGKANIKAAANKPERIEKIKAAWILRKQKMKESGETRVNRPLLATIVQEEKIDEFLAKGAAPKQEPGNGQENRYYGAIRPPETITVGDIRGEKYGGEKR